MDDIVNPFVSLKSDNTLKIPRFPRTKEYKVSLSEEAAINLTNILTQYDLNLTQGGLSRLIEAIGLFALTLTEPKIITDKESGITTEDCRNSGFEDAMEGNPQRFLALFGKITDDEFQQQYIRGYFEGNFVKNTMSKDKS